MERWVGRVAVVTGAGSGIGAAVATSLVKCGLNVVGVDYKNHEGVKELAINLKNEPGKLNALQADITKEENVLQVFDWIKNNLGGVDILVNSAGVLHWVELSDLSSEKCRQMFDVNVIALSIFTREALKLMEEKGVDDGHIVNICSILGHILARRTTVSLYSATKHAVKVLSEGLRRELVQKKSKIRVTNVSPGITDTQILHGSRLTDPSIPKLSPEDIANAVIYALGAPPHVQVHELTIRPVGETF